MPNKFSWDIQVRMLGFLIPVFKFLAILSLVGLAACVFVVLAFQYHWFLIIIATTITCMLFMFREVCKMLLFLSSETKRLTDTGMDHDLALKAVIKRYWS
jgi:hypothetical protein